MGDGHDGRGLSVAMLLIAANGGTADDFIQSMDERRERKGERNMGPDSWRDPYGVRGDW